MKTWHDLGCMMDAGFSRSAALTRRYRLSPGKLTCLTPEASLSLLRRLRSLHFDLLRERVLQSEHRSRGSSSSGWNYVSGIVKFSIWI